MLTIIRNGYQTHKDEVVLPTSKVKRNVALILASEKYITSAEELEGRLVINLRYVGKNPAITEIKRISKPGQKIYVNKENVPRVLNGFGLAIVSTSKGIMSSQQARQDKVGGELMCEIW